MATNYFQGVTGAVDLATLSIPGLHLWLAERLWVPCLGYGGEHPTGYGCLECGGTGRIYPLRVHYAECLYNSDLDTMLGTVRRKGWYLALQQYGDGDTVWLHTDKVNQVPYVAPTEGLRGTHAITLAVARAVQHDEPK